MMPRYTNKSLAKAFAEGTTKGETSNGTLYIRGNLIFSYNDGWPIAKRNGNIMLINGDKISPTTSKHTTLVASQAAYAGYQLVYVGRKELV